MDMSAIHGTYQCDKSMLVPPNSTPSKEPFKIAKRAGKKGAVSKSLELSMTQEMARYKVWQTILFSFLNFNLGPRI